MGSWTRRLTDKREADRLGLVDLVERVGDRVAAVRVRELAGARLEVVLGLALRVVPG